MNKVIYILLGLVGWLCVQSQDRSLLAPTPPMGWNSFDSYGVYLHEQAAFDNLEAMAQKLKPYGYEYFVVDNGWFGEYQLRPGTLFAMERHASDVRINAYGLLQPSQCYFPNGFDRLIKRCHALGLKFGVHLMRGIPRKAVEQNLPIQGTSYRAADIADTVNICHWCHYNYGVDMSKPGAQEFYNSLINQLAGWGVDFIKVDDIVPFPEEVEALVKAVEQCGRKMVISLSPGDKVPAEHLETFSQAQMLRVTGDVWDTQGDIDKCFAAWKKWQGKEIPGFWFDMDMIPFGQLQLMSPRTLNTEDISQTALYAGRGYTRTSELNPEQMRTFITMRALAASPLMVGGDLMTMDAYSLHLLTHPEMLACNRNGKVGRLVYQQGQLEVWKSEANSTEGWIGIFNRGKESCSSNLSYSDLSLESTSQLKDIWNEVALDCPNNQLQSMIPAHDVLFIRYSSTGSIQASDRLQQLVARLLPGYEKQFVFLQEPTNGDDYFEITSSGGKIQIKGNSPVSLASGLNWYLKYNCQVSTSWCGNQLQMPKKLPLPKEIIRKQTPLHTGFYLNYCTFSYSMPFWGWEEWEKEIDRMAMNGITTPMAMVGVESVWRNTLRRFNYSDDEIKKFLPGPAYMGWFLMGNLEGMGGPMPDEWFERQEQLQHKILARMKEYDMEPVYQAFFGMVPGNLPTKYPEADIVGQGKWINFDRPAILNPIDPLFGKMAAVWYEEYEKLYGKARYYGGDLFHEGGKKENIDVTEAAEYVQDAMQEAVPGSIWILQSWGGNPVNELLAGLVKEQTLVVDLCAEYWDRWNERNAFGGFPWIWANITNWGGNIGLHGRLDAIASEPVKARNTPSAAPFLKGVGNVPEGIGTNPVSFDLACEMRWRDSIPSLTHWLHTYAAYRYGKPDEVLNQAWDLLYQTAYGTYKGHRRPSESYLCARPSLKVTTVSAWGSARIYYPEETYEQAVRLFASARGRFKGQDAYEYDLVDFTRQLVANKGRMAYKKAIRHYKNKDVDSVAYYGEQFLKLVLLQDRLLSCRPEFCVSGWINQARNCTTNPSLKDQMEFNARALITTWADEPSELVDYAHREWSGLLREYYYPRWKMFFEWLNRTANGEQLPAPDYYPIEKAWVHATEITETPTVDLYQVVDECLNFR